MEAFESNLKEGNREFTDVSIRRVDVSDIDDFMEWATDDKLTRFSSWEPYKSREEGINHIKNTVIPHPWFRAICLNNKPIGAIWVTPKSGNNKCRSKLGYVLGSKYWGKGIATKAVKIVIDTIFDEWPQLDRLEALVDVENIGSQKVLEKVGFQREGVLRMYLSLHREIREMIIFSLLSTAPKR